MSQNFLRTRERPVILVRNLFSFFLFLQTRPVRLSGTGFESRTCVVSTVSSRKYSNMHPAINLAMSMKNKD